MGSTGTETLPSLLVFGPQAELPSKSVIEELRLELITSSALLALREAVEQLPVFWRELIKFDPDLAQVPGNEFLGHIKQWLEEGGALPHQEEGSPNHYALAVTVLLQLSQYSRYLSRLGRGAHSRVVQNLKQGGIQGFCIGFLNAVAVASSSSESDLGAYAAAALRLAVCIGAYVDLDGRCASTRKDFSAVAVLWKEKTSGNLGTVPAIVKSIPGAYISSINDHSSVTITLKTEDVDRLTEISREKNLRVKRIGVHGRFHNACHLPDVEKIMKFISTSDKLQFPDATELKTPLRDTKDGQLISAGSLTRIALENTLLNVAEWSTTVEASIRELKPTEIIRYAGFSMFMPTSTLRNFDLRLEPLLDPSTSTPITNGHGTSNNPNGGVNGVNSPTESPDLSQYPPHSIAIVGMASRFPDADSVDELWDLIMAARSTVEAAPVERLNLPQTGAHANVKWWGNFLKDPTAFDHKFFRKSPREAVAWDPQQRILLEVIYEALESSGYFGASKATQPDDFGCYIGAVMNNYYDNLTCHTGTAYATVGTSRCYLSGCMSHYFGWTGPSLTIDTACSSSLVAINSACRAIWSGECSRAVAGGTNVISSPFDYQNLAAAGFLSPSGQCKPFDSGADGYCRGEGVAAVVLKPLKDAIKENDTIFGVIVGSAANQNHNISQITAPYSPSQVDLYNKVMKLGGVTPEAVSYVEAHGTGTGVGDPIEVRSIRDAFGGPDRESVLHFASIKGNIGHTEATAGIAGLIKVLLMMRHRQIPAQASHSSLNPKLPDFSAHAMQIPKSIIPWEASSLVACVNSYGAAGSNSAVIIREKPILRYSTTHEPLSTYPLFLSAGSETSLSNYCRKLLQWLKSPGGKGNPKDLATILFNLADRGNHTLQHTLSTSVRNLADLEVKLRSAADGADTTKIPEKPKSAVLVFGGQESDFIGLSESFYKSARVFREHLDSVNNLLVLTGLESIYPSVFESKPLTSLTTLHSALFAVQYASAMAWIDSGLQVSAVVGHSFGQLTAFCISGVLSLADALKLVTGRASMMQKYWGSEAGSMLFLQASSETVSNLLRDFKLEYDNAYVEIACYNGPESHVVVGSSEAIGNLQYYVSRHQSSIRMKKLNVTNGFHSRFTEPMLPHLDALAKQLEWKQPEIYLETTDEHGSMTAPDYDIASKHTRQPVFFARAIERIATKFSHCSWVEAGRGSSVMTMVKSSVPNSQLHSFHSPQLASATAQDSLTSCTVELWKIGHAVQFWPFNRVQKLQYEYLSLPPIQFDKTRHWLGFTGRTDATDGEARAAEVEESHELLKFVHFQDGAKTKAIFQINPNSERFQKMVGGHVMAGESLAPASLYFEVVSRAALLLEGDEQALKYVPTVKNLSMRSPIGASITKQILLLLQKLNGPNASWSFSITTRDIEDKRTEPFEHSTGTVHLKRRDDTEAARDFARFQTLTGHARWESLMRHPDAEKMRGNHIYRAFNTVVYYGEPFRGIKDVACVGSEAAGKVQVTLPAGDPADQRLCDTPMTDSFMQFAGFLVNYFNNTSIETVFVCGKIEHIEIGGDFDPDAGEWLVYSNMSEGGETDAASDVYIFDAKTKKMVMIAFGFRFSKMQQSMLQRMLKSVNKVKPTVGQPVEEDLPPTVASAASLVEKTHTRKSESQYSGKRQDIFQILSNVTDVPLDEITDDSTLDDLGVDSLMATEVLNDLRAALGITIDLSSFLFFPNVDSIVKHVDEKLGLSVGDARSETSGDSGISDMDEISPQKEHRGSPPESIKTTISDAARESQPELSSAVTAFEEVRLNYDKFAETTGAAGFWENAYPPQARLVLAYVVEAFAELGCDLRALKAGSEVPQINALSKHSQLVRQLYRILEDGKLLATTGDGNLYSRTSKTVENGSAESIYYEIIDLYPQHASINKLVRAVGSQFAACLRGDKEGIQVVFGDRETKKTLEDMYEFSPLLRTPTLVLGNFLATAISKATGKGKFRLLEIGAGTGGTTRYIVDLLQTLGVDYEYVYTDISQSLVNTAAKRMKGTAGLKFEVLDIEKPPEDSLLGAFHFVIATNCIHATRDLETSLRHTKQMLRPDGALALIEITKNMYWLDIVVGLLEGWWLFEDGREHALVNEKHWERRMKAAGFQEVAWSDGATPESKTVRVVAAFPESAETETEKPVKAAMETFVYKTVGKLEIQADVYYPTETARFVDKELPVALMIHGGSHMIFSRKDIRPAQTRLLLSKGFVPISVDYRLCPEVSLSEGAMVDVCDALDWCRNQLPTIALLRFGLRIDGQNLVVVGWSSGGQLAMSLAWTAPLRGLRPPSAALVFYAPTDYEDQWWLNPIQPNGAPYKGQEYSVLDSVQETPITGYGIVGAWEEPISNPDSINDPRCRLILHINWKAQTLPVILNGLPSKSKALEMHSNVQNWNALPQPSLDVIRAASPRAHVRNGTYGVPTFFIHGAADDLIPWQQSQETYQTMLQQGIETDLVLLDGAPHICDLSSDPRSDGWKATVRGYNFICSRVNRLSQQ